MKIGFIGAGKVGFSLGRYFVEKGISVMGYYSKSPVSAQQAAVFTKSAYFINLEEIVNSCDIIFITTQDDAIQTVWSQIRKLSIKGKIICHCSGSLTSKVFEEIQMYEAYAYSVHPLYAIGSKAESYKELEKAYFTIEGDAKEIEKMEDLLRRLGNSYQIISEENKRLYHIAAVTVSNQVIALIQQGIENLTKCGFQEDAALYALWPLIQGNIEAIHKKGIREALTGPVERNDIGTVSKHLEVLQGEDKLLYILLSLKLVSIAKAKKTMEDYEPLCTYLEKQLMS